VRGWAAGATYSHVQSWSASRRIDWEELEVGKELGKVEQGRIWLEVNT
jgi:hypothetical protein